MKVRIPKEIKIGATPAYIELKPNLHSDDGFDGTFNKRTGMLHIDERLGSAIRDKTFGHELNEVIKANYEIDISERDMSCLANGWLEFLSQIGIEFDWSDIT